jgi:hypothetical protein
VALSAGIFSQDKAVRLIEFDPKVENDSTFEAKARLFVRELGASEKTTLGYVSLYTNDRLAGSLSKVLNTAPELRKRFFMLQPGIRYQGIADIIEFWLVPAKAEPPFAATCINCACPTLEVRGEQFLFDGSMPRKSLVFSASLSGNESVTYNWSVDGGKIVSSKTNSAIKVEPEPGATKEITATVTIGGLDPDCYCLNTATFTTHLRKKIELQDK